MGSLARRAFFKVSSKIINETRVPHTIWAGSADSAPLAK
jgi:hypothetical protein